MLRKLITHCIVGFLLATGTVLVVSAATPKKSPEPRQQTCPCVLANRAGYPSCDPGGGYPTSHLNITTTTNGCPCFAIVNLQVEAFWYQLDCNGTYGAGKLCNFVVVGGASDQQGNLAGFGPNGDKAGQCGSTCVEDVFPIGNGWTFQEFTCPNTVYVQLYLCDGCSSGCDSTTCVQFIENDVSLRADGTRICDVHPHQKDQKTAGKDKKTQQTE